MYLALNPERRGAKSSTVRSASFSAVGKVKPPSILSPKFSHKRSIIPLILGILLFCEIIKEQSASHGSCFKSLIPPQSLVICFNISVLRALVRISL